MRHGRAGHPRSDARVVAEEELRGEAAEGVSAVGSLSSGMPPGDCHLDATVDAKLRDDAGDGALDR